MIGSKIYRLVTCTSTNDVAKRLAQEGAEEGTAVVAEEQTAGRGTKGRGWESAAGKGLYASVIVRPGRSNIALLPLVAGVACAEAIQRATGLEVRLKWPNDIVWRGRKVGGILSESGFMGEKPSYVILGIGINVGHQKRDFPQELRSTASSLRLALNSEIEKETLERALWKSLDRWYRVFGAGKERTILRAFESKLVFPVGTVIRVTRETGTVSGIFRGVDSQARLILESEGKNVVLLPADILNLS
jgi:BirA family biotin operon repressor/biotin-[acetyl-CoA-carboxylase] ligase